MNLQQLNNNLNLNVLKITPVSGGDINYSYKLICEENVFFIKINQKHNYPHLFLRESEGLNKLKVSNYIKIPEVIKVGEFEDLQYLLLEWIDTESNININYNEYLARGLASIHKTSNETFGLENNNFIGTLIQSNKAHSNWADFYYTERLLPLTQLMVKQNNLGTSTLKELEKLPIQLDSIFPNEAPALLHGDLWNGNVMKGNKGYPCLYDPAIYFGHREMDLGMTLLFGGFSPEFYEYYNHYYPLEKGWRNRLELTQLYPLLVHACLFGGGYVSSCLKTINKFGK